MAESQRSMSFDLTDDQPLIAVPLDENGQQVVRYYTSEDAADQDLASRKRYGVRHLAGAWLRVDPDLDWESLADELDRLRHDSAPTPPIDLD